MNTCECGSSISNKKANKCRKCWLRVKGIFCIDCKKKMKRKTKSERCRSCHFIEIKKPKVCVTCGKQKTYRGRSRDLCDSCCRKKEWADNREKKNLYHRNYKRKAKGIDLSLPNLKSGLLGSKDKSGYRTVIAHGHPNAKNKKGRIYEHILIYSQFLGRALKKGETIHHKNGIRDDNRLENLELWHRGQPAGQRLEEKIKGAIEFLEQYDYIITKRTP